MEDFPTYKTLSDFKKNYEIVYSKYNSSFTPIEFYSKYHDLYSLIYTEFDNLWHKLNSHNLGIHYKKTINSESKNIFIKSLNNEIQDSISFLLIEDIDILISNIKFKINQDLFILKLKSLKEQNLINNEDELYKMQGELIGITSFLDDLIETEKINLLRFSSSQNSNTNTSQQIEIEPYTKEEGKKNIPYKLALLRELGLMDILNTRYDNNKEQLYRILEFLTGGNAKSYYLSMYGDNYNGKDRVTKSHTAYLRKNRLI